MKRLTLVLLSILPMSGQAIPAERCEAFFTDSGAGVKAQSRLIRVTEWLKPAERSVSTHAFEERGRVAVPIDYDFALGPTLNVAYRILPVMEVKNGQVEYFHPRSPIARRRPILIVMNGGPGASSEHLRKLTFGYDGSLPQDRVVELSRRFRVVLVDQRGTDGRSSALDFDQRGIEAQLIADAFGPRPVALDHAAVARAIVSPREPFYILAQSYGGMIGANYLVEMERDSSLPRPAAIALTSAGIQTADEAFARQIVRRRTQRELSLQLKQSYPEIVEFMDRLRRRIEQVDPASTVVDSLATRLGRGEDWQAEFKLKILQLLTLSDADLRREINQDYATIEPFNFILSSVIITPGYTDRTMYLALKDVVPLEPWMPDELRNYYNGKADSDWQNAWLDQIDRQPPLQPRMATKDEMRAAVAKTKTRLIVTGSVDDPLIPVSTSRELFESLRDQRTRYLEFEKGGHSAAFVAPNFERLVSEGFGLGSERP